MSEIETEAEPEPPVDAMNMVFLKTSKQCQKERTSGAYVRLLAVVPVTDRRAPKLVV